MSDKGYAYYLHSAHGYRTPIQVEDVYYNNTVGNLLNVA